jgi:hypothetical protein
MTQPATYKHNQDLSQKHFIERWESVVTGNLYNL